jgi:hypothetical protein
MGRVVAAPQYRILHFDIQKEILESRIALYFDAASSCANAAFCAY